MHTNVRSLRAALLGLVALATVSVLPAKVSADEPVMYAHYIDVGQGSCTLLEFSCGAILIDTGGDGDAHVDSLIAYLNAFFQRRPDLNRTLESVIISHAHIDHTRGLREVIENFKVKCYIDNGRFGKSDEGGTTVRWIRRQVAAGKLHMPIIEIKDEAIAALPRPTGLTNANIDPLQCAACDPVVTVLSGGLQVQKPGWSKDEFKNANNHSVLVRVDFGRAFFLFTGDLEEEGIRNVLGRYTGTTLLDVDVYLVGHHGAKNATNKPFLGGITPQIAVMGTGKWNDGMEDPDDDYTTYQYGHPRAVVVKMLSDAIQRKRTPAITKRVADGVRNFRDTTITKSIYATGWDGTIDIRATLDGKYTVTHGQN